MSGEVMYGPLTWFGMLIIMLCALRRKTPRMAIQDLLIGSVLVVGTAFMPTLISASTVQRPILFDAVFYRIDLALGLDGRQLCAYTMTHASFHEAITIVYMATAFALMVAYAVERNFAFVWSVAVASALAPVFYFIFPAIDPNVAFPGYPFKAPHPAFSLMSNPSPAAAVNCFPSMHMTWAILIVLNAKSWKLRAPAMLFAIGTAMATIGLGEHYVVDLLAAVPYSLGVVWLCSKIRSLRFGKAGAQMGLGRLIRINS